MGETLSTDSFPHFLHPFSPERREEAAGFDSQKSKFKLPDQTRLDLYFYIPPFLRIYFFYARRNRHGNLERTAHGGGIGSMAHDSGRNIKHLPQSPLRVVMLCYFCYCSHRFVCVCDV